MTDAGWGQGTGEGIGTGPGIATTPSSVGIERRRAERRRVDLPGRILLPGGRERDCVVVDLSATGAKVAVEPGSLLPERFDLACGLRRPRPVRVAWRDGCTLGVAFEG